MFRTTLLAIFLTFSVSPSSAQGLFDFLDPCIAAKNDYWQARGEIIAKIDQELAAVPGEATSAQFKDFWWEEKRKLLRQYFDENLGEVVKAGGGDVERAFQVWLAVQVKKQGGMTSIDPIIDADYKNTKKIVLEKKKGATQAKLDETKSSLYSGCPEDVGNQVFRGAVTILTAPVNIVSGNISAAGNESGDLAKLLRAITGVSAGDIEKNGVCGGSNSEMRKLFGSLC